MGIDTTRERRRDHRLYVPATAVLFVEGVEIGQYAVDNLSPGGALLTGDMSFERGESVQLLLQMDGGDETVQLDARVVRTHLVSGPGSAIAVAFELASAGVEDALREALVEAPVELPERVTPELWDIDDPDIVAIIPQPN